VKWTTTDKGLRGLNRVSEFKVIVIGAGIGGLTVGIALRQAGFQVNIYDKVRHLKPIGAGISLWSNGVKVMNALGLGDKMAQIGGQMNHMQYLSKTGVVLNDIPLQPLIDQVGQRPYPLARTALQQMLRQAFDGPVYLGQRCVGVKETAAGVTAGFEDGSEVTGDVLIAADGVRSQLRNYVLGHRVEPSYQGYVNWNGLVPIAPDLAPADTWVIYVGEHQRASMMPVANGQFYFFFDVPLPEQTEAAPEQYQTELAHYFAGWAKPVQCLIERIDPQQVARLNIRDLGPIDTYVRGRVALLGDAAHATCPDLGQGGAQAMEDGYVLSQCLQNAVQGDGDIVAALGQYEAQRKERANGIVQKARSRSHTIHGIDPQRTEAWYQQLATEKPTDVTDAIATTILGGPLH
jgi:FAD-dependent urate hydroxylase